MAAQFSSPNMPRSTALFDADNTLWEGFCIFPIFDAFVNEGFVKATYGQQLHEIYDQYQAKELEYHTFALEALRIAAQGMVGKRHDTATRLSRLIFTEHYPWFEYVAPTVEALRSAHVHTAIITAEPDFMAEGIAQAAELESYYGSTFSLDSSDCFTGDVEHALGSTEKGKITTALVGPASVSFGFGDSEGDIGMLEVVTHPYCIRPTDSLRLHAEAHGWRIIDNPNQRQNLVANEL